MLSAEPPEPLSALKRVDALLYLVSNLHICTNSDTQQQLLSLNAIACVCVWYFITTGILSHKVH
jgi:hypothetical protein